MQKFSSYRIVIRLSALLLITGLALPASLCAGQLVELNRNSHGTETHSSDVSHLDHHEMAEEENCHTSVPDKPDADTMAHHDCQEDAGCTCHFDRAPINDQKRVITTTAPSIDLFATIIVEQENHEDYSRYHFPFPELYTAPPIFIMNSTFLN